MRNDDQAEFMRTVVEEVAAQGKNGILTAATKTWFHAATASRYSYHFSAFGRPIIQYPQDQVAVQELIWAIKPDLIIETGIARGGSLVMSAGMLSILDFCDAATEGQTVDPRRVRRNVVGVDIDIRDHNRAAIEAHPLSPYITMIQGSSIDPKVVAALQGFAERAQRVLVLLDSNHTHDHVLAELNALAPLVTVDSYCIVFDTIIEDLPTGSTGDRPWGPGNSPRSAVKAFLSNHPEFQEDAAIPNRLLITVAPGGYLKRVRGGVG